MYIHNYFIICLHFLHFHRLQISTDSFTALTGLPREAVLSMRTATRPPSAMSLPTCSDPRTTKDNKNTSGIHGDLNLTDKWQMCLRLNCVPHVFCTIRKNTRLRTQRSLHGRKYILDPVSRPEKKWEHHGKSWNIINWNCWISRSNAPNRWHLGNQDVHISLHLAKGCKQFLLQGSPAPGETCGELEIVWSQRGLEFWRIFCSFKASWRYQKSIKSKDQALGPPCPVKRNWKQNVRSKHQNTSRNLCLIRSI